MSEQRLIDANAEAEWAIKNLPDPYSGVIIQFLRGCKTIDPSTMSIVRELREKLYKVTMERDAEHAKIKRACEFCEAVSGDSTPMCKAGLKCPLQDDVQVKKEMVS